MLKKGANINLKDKQGRSVVDIASTDKSLRALFAHKVPAFKVKPLSSEFEIKRSKPDEIFVDINNVGRRVYT